MTSDMLVQVNSRQRSCQAIRHYKAKTHEACPWDPASTALGWEEQRMLLPSFLVLLQAVWPMAPLKHKQHDVPWRVHGPGTAGGLETVLLHLAPVLAPQTAIAVLSD